MKKKNNRRKGFIQIDKLQIKKYIKIKTNIGTCKMANINIEMRKLEEILLKTV